MTPRRAAAYIGGALLLAAWLASAAGTVWQDPWIQPLPDPVRTGGTDTLAADVQASAERLKQRLSAAPAPQSPSRNPFTFETRTPAAPRRAPLDPVVTLAEPIAPFVPAAPSLTLIGIAEDESPDGVVRTAIITADRDELFLVKTGESLGGRYTVTAIGPDVVELSDLATGAIRRLALR